MAWPTVISAFLGGYLYYLTRRATVFIVFPILAHAAFDLFAFSHYESTGGASFNMVVLHVVLFIVTAALWKLVSPRAAKPRGGGRAGTEVPAQAGQEALETHP